MVHREAKERVKKAENRIWTALEKVAPGPDQDEIAEGVEELLVIISRLTESDEEKAENDRIFGRR